MQCNAEQRAHCNCCVCSVVVKYICISALVSLEGNTGNFVTVTARLSKSGNFP